MHLSGPDVRHEDRRNDRRDARRDVQRDDRRDVQHNRRDDPSEAGTTINK